MTDITTKEQVDELVVRFYDRLLADEGIADHFRHLDLHEHLPRIAAFWNMVLFGDRTFQGDPMTAHKKLNTRLPMHPDHFAHWVKLFQATVDELFTGPKADEAKQRAQSIAGVMMHKVL